MAQLIDIQTTLSPPLGRDTIIPTLNTGRGCRHPPGWRTQRSRASNWIQPRRSGPTFIHMYLVLEVSVSDLKSKNAYLSISITHTSHLCCGGPPSLLASYPLISGFCGWNNGCVLIRCPLPHTQQQQCCRCLLCARLFTITGDIYYSFLLCSFVRNQNQSRAGQGPGEVTRCCIQCIVRQHVPRSAAQPRIASLHQLSIRCLPGAWCLQLAQERNRPQHWSRGDAELYF